MDASRKKALKDFMAEAEDLLEALADDIETAQEQFETSGKVKPDLTNKIFREMHSLKGLASMFGLERISTLSHDLESLLDKVRLGKVKLSAGFFALLNESRSSLLKLVAEAGKGEEKTEISALLEKIAKGPESASEAEPVGYGDLPLDENTAKSLTEYEEHRLRENMDEGNQIYGVRVSFDFSDFDFRLRELTEKLSEAGEVISTLPVMGAEASEGIHFRLIYGTTLKLGQVQQLVIEEKGEVELLSGRPEAPESSAPEDKEAGKETTAGEDSPRESGDIDLDDFRDISNTLKVNIDKLDYVMGIVGEMNLLKVAFERLLGTLKVIPGQEDTAADMSRQVRQLGKKLEELQRAIIEIRLVPIGQSFNRLKRTARRLARNAAKQIDVRLYGGETELDKMIMDKLMTSLVHVLRNSIDHGLEPPEERISLGKPEDGLLTISAFQRGNSIVIEVSDDGRGLQVEKIKKVAIQKGLMKPEENLSTEECLDFIFMPGFSSSEKVTSVSGRGVGLDAVKVSIEEMKGSIGVWSEPGKGTTFQIELPITLAIIQSLIVTCAGEFFAIPISSVLESFKTTEEEIQRVDNKEVFNLRGATLPLLRLEERFGLSGEKEDIDSAEIFVVVARKGERLVGIVVDELQGEQETVVHPIGSTLGRLPGIAGATEVGENKVILVIDTASLLTTLGTVRA